MYTYTYTPNTKAPKSLDDIKIKIAEVELLRTKLDAYHSATELSPNGTSAMSESKAKREILGMTDAQITDDLLVQFSDSKTRSDIAQADELAGANSRFYGSLDESTGDNHTETPEKDMQIFLLQTSVKQLEEDLTLVYQEITECLKHNADTINELKNTVSYLTNSVLNQKS